MNKLFIYRVTIMVLLVFNTSATLFLLNTELSRKNIKPAPSQGNTISKAEFPKGLDASVITEIFYAISEPYSKKDFDQLMTLLDPDVRKRFGDNNIRSAFNKLYNIFGPIVEGFFSSVYPVNSTDKRLYKINFDVSLTNHSTVGPKAMLSVTIQMDDNNYRIKGIFLNILPQQE